MGMQKCRNHTKVRERIHIESEYSQYHCLRMVAKAMHWTMTLFRR